MLSRIHNKLGTAGLVVAIVALVAALGGAAYAASDNHLSGGEKKEVKKIAKQFAGKKGATGAQGPAGTPGPAGKDGAKGATGSEGKQGLEGEKGATGIEGSPWTAGGTLPSGKTETGSWGNPASGNGILAVSFTLPLAAKPAAADIHVLKEGEEETTECPGTPEDPKAAKGQLCLYTFSNAEEAVQVHTNFFSGQFEIPGLIQVSGVNFPYGAAEGALAYGTWAVTAK